MSKMLIDGQLAEKPDRGDGRFERQETTFRHRIEDRQSARFPSDPARYHLYASHACPWSHRVLLARALLSLDEIGVTQMAVVKGDESWSVDQGLFDEAAGVPRDCYLYEVYCRADPAYTGAISVPVLWDKIGGTIVNNESAETLRMLGDVFGKRRGIDLYPAPLRDEIDEMNGRIQRGFCEAVYRGGFATTQTAYDDAATSVFDCLAWLDDRLAARTWLVGDGLTEADLRVFPTLLRFDPIYHTHFRLDRARVSDHPNVSAYVDRVREVPGVENTIDMERTRKHYFRSHRQLSPYGIIPIGPQSLVR